MNESKVSAIKVLNLIANLDLEAREPTYKIRKIDYCYELEFDDYLIYYEFNYIDIHYKSSDPICIKLDRKNNKFFKVIFKLLLISYLKSLYMNSSAD